jgi:transketolase N-terminal domain/subunit
VDLEDISRKIRILSSKAASKAGVGHLGGAFSAAEILAVLYFDMRKK